jgi:general bacterial porin, GBP family
MRLKLISQGVMGAAFVMAAGTACAQTSVTLYGVADTFFQYLNNGGTASVSQRSGGSTGSMFGLKGSEDLGGGLKANFVLENGYNINNGSGFADTTALFYRQSWVGFAHADYGSLTFGRQYQPSFRAVYPSDPFHANEVLSPLSAAVLATDRNTLSAQYAAGRTSNSILYVSPKLAGFQLNAMYGFSATVTQPVPATTGNILDVSATYSGGGLFVGLAYMNEHSGVETVPGLPSALTLVGTEHYTAAIAYRIGIVNLQANYSYASPKTPPAHSLAAVLGTAHAYNVTEIGASIQASSFDAIQIAGIQRNIHGINDETLGVELGYDHQISKRTSVYARAGYLKNHGEAMMSWPGISVVAPHTSQTLAVVGISHLF